MRIFNKGQVVIPAVLRKKYNIKIGDVIEIVPETNAIKLIPTKKESLVDKLFGVFASYKEGKALLTEEEIDKVTEEEFFIKHKNEIY